MRLEQSDDFDAWFARAIVFTPGSSIRLQELVNAFRRSIDPSQHRHWPFNRFLFRLRASLGRFEPQAPVYVANVWWSRPALVVGDDGLLREAE